MPIKQLQVARIIQFVMMVAGFMYMGIAEFLTLKAHRAPITQTMYRAIAIIAAVDFAVATFIFLKSLNTNYQNIRGGTGDHTATLRHLMKSHLVVFAVAESIILFGFVVRFMGATLSQAVPFYIAGMFLFVMGSPRSGN